MTSTRTCEVCIDSVEGAVIAEQSGADRVELCANLVEGGTTPSAGMIEAVLATTKLPVMVMLRPRGGDFCYSPAERDVMQADLDFISRQRAAGVVIGALLPNGEIDMPTCRQLCQQLAGLSITFHRAFDQTVDPRVALAQLVELGVDRVLTSGQSPSAEQGIPMLRHLVSIADNRISIMPGAGITAENVGRILHRTSCHEVHFSGSELIESPVTFRRADVPMSAERTPGDGALRVTSAAKVRAIVKAVSGGETQK